MASEPQPRPPRRRAPFRRPRSPIWFGAALFGLLLLANVVAAFFHQGRTLDYSEFKSLLAQGRIVEVQLSKDAVDGKYQDGSGNQIAFNAVRVEDPNLAQQLDAAKVRYAGEAQNEWLS